MRLPNSGRVCNKTIMNEPSAGNIDRDAKLTAYYKAAGDDLPPPALDAAVLAAAHRATAAKPRLAGTPFSRAWRVPLSMAAVLVLSVSLVTLMREEAPDIVQPQGADLSRRDEKRAPGAMEAAAPATATLADSQKSSGLGLKPSSSSSPSGLGLRSSTDPGMPGRLRLESSDPHRTGPALSGAASAPPSTPEAFPLTSAARDMRPSESAAKMRLPARDEAQNAASAERAATPVAKTLTKLETDNNARVSDDRRAPGAAGVVGRSAPAASDAAEGRVRQDPIGPHRFQGQPPSGVTEARPDTPAAKTASPGVLARPAAVPATPALSGDSSASVAETLRSHVVLPPEVWLARIELLHKQGRLEEARVSLAEFRKRYPAHPLPASLNAILQ